MKTRGVEAWLGGAMALAGICALACASTGAPEPHDEATGGGATGGGLGAAGTGAAAPDPSSACEADDGICDPAETCECADCKGRIDCGLATCVTDGACSPSESCLCAECALLPKCANTCLFDDGPCTAAKSCGCEECASVPECAALDYSCSTDTPGGCSCIDDGVCDPTLEPCTCDGCEVTGMPLSQAACSPVGCYDAPDGACTWLETCACVDCFGDARCAAKVDACQGAPDGACADGESCDCPDCMLLGQCVVPYCLPQEICGLAESCICPGCPGQLDCLKVKTCVDDGACAPWEGCYCIDCASAPACLPFTDGCTGNAPDGTCQVGEACACLDCLETEACVTCDADGVCDAMEACLCEDCQEPLTQVGPSVWTSNPCFAQPCNDDGVCQTLHETCACSDCFGAAACADNVTSCTGAAPDGTCEAAEACACVDCWGKGKCITVDDCADDGVCDFGKELLLCPDCAGLGLGCAKEDAYCTASMEGCGCQDCADAPACQP